MDDKYSFVGQNRSEEQAIEIYKQRIKDSEEVFNLFSSEFRERDCPVCGAAIKEKLDKFNNQYEISRCRSCNSIYVDPAPDLRALDYYYNKCACNTQLGTLLKSRVGKKGAILSERVSSVIRLIEAGLSKTDHLNILEVGCNSGAFLFELECALVERGIIKKVRLVGIDIDGNAVRNPVSETLNLHHSSVEEFVLSRENYFDLILHFELIEHLHDPFEFLLSSFRLLKPGGRTFFHTPNSLGLDNMALGYNDFRPLAHGIFPPMHLNSFTTQNVVLFLNRAGFLVDEVNTPGNFDVDIVARFGTSGSDFSALEKIAKAGLGDELQRLVRNMRASAHLEVVASKGFYGAQDLAGSLDNR